ncbi:MAG TPA: MarR family transcriptional regulator [Candidatus Nitrosotalea sp.]|nr:MarR family transcriptional regulator [Candidatus Nitrosotalea sp.]
MTKNDFETSVGFVVNTTAKAFQRVLDMELRKNVGVTIYQWRVVVTLIQFPGITQKEIADRVGIESATLVPVIDKMEKEGLLKRKPDAKDRRVNRISLTSKADSLWNSMLECAIRIRKASAKGIPDGDLATTLQTLKQISKNLSEYFELDVVTTREK